VKEEETEEAEEKEDHVFNSTPNKST